MTVHGHVVVVLRLQLTVRMSKCRRGSLSASRQNVWLKLEILVILHLFFLHHASPITVLVRSKTTIHSQSRPEQLSSPCWYCPKISTKMMMRLLAALLTASAACAFAPGASRLATKTSMARAVTPATTTQLPAQMLQDQGIAEKYYMPQAREAPKILGGLKIGFRELAVVTGASSGLGLNCAATLAKTGKYFVVMGCRDVEKGKRGQSWNRFSIFLNYNSASHTFIYCSFTVAKEMGMPDNSYVVMKLELASLQSVRDFVANLKAFKAARPLNHLICNAAVYLPKDPQPKWTDDGFEMSLGVNHLGHFLLVNLLMDDMSRAKNARCCIVGSITGNTNTVGGGLVYPFADLGKLQGMEKLAKGEKNIAMPDGKPFFGAKAYKDSKVSNNCKRT